ncbi:MAG: tRNA (adenosine(37)-N6)-dimethylallyltransferase MiaA [Thermomicrobiales bacterium]
MANCTDNPRGLTPGLPVVVILGLTATGKTGLSLALAERFDIEIVNADSRYLYRGMDVGTAKPSAEELAAVPHHLVDTLEPDAPYSLALFLDDAFKAIEAIGGRGRLPVVVGGTPQYLRGLIEGWQAPRVPPDEDLRARLEQQPVEDLYRRVQAVDPESAERVGPTNARRLIRALEVWEKSGVPLSEQQGKHPPPYRMLIIGLQLDRDVLYARIDERARRMFANGLLDEARALLRYDASLPSMSAIGYREARAVVQGEMSVEEAIAQTSYATHRFARHQQTWYRRFEGVQWFDAEDEGLVERVSDVVDSLVGDADEP